MITFPTTLTFVTTLRCTAACRNCCFDCSPRRHETLSGDDMLTAIRDLRNLPSVKLVVFTGGECTLLGDDLLQAIRACRKMGLATRCVTNGHWADTSGKAHAYVSQLREAGLTEINFSTGENHSQFVPKDSIRNGVIASLRSGLVTAVAKEETRANMFSTDFLEDDEEIQQAVPKGKFRIICSPWIDVADGITREHRPEFSRSQPEKHKPCKTVLSSISVMPSGAVNLCCGLHVSRIPSLQAGNVSQAPLSDILRAQKDDLLKMWLHTRGPDHIVKEILDDHPDFRVPQTFHPCETCLFLYSSRSFRSLLEKKIYKRESGIVASYAATVAKSFLRAGVSGSARVGEMS